jgi:hypothetical protein
VNARDELYAALMAGGPHSPDRSEKASALIDAFRDVVVDGLVERSAVALGGCCTECDIAVTLVRRRGDVIKGVKW